MKHDIKLDGSPLPISDALKTLLQKMLNDESKHADEEVLSCIIFNFRDPTYSAESGGFHPVEIFISTERKGSSQCTIDYITDFALVGHPYPELVKEIDFDFTNKRFLMAFGGSFSLDDNESKSFYKLWESNFISYVNEQCLSDTSVTAYGDYHWNTKS